MKLMNLMSARWSLLVLLVVGLASATSAVNAYDGRWKIADDGSCYWDSTDSGDDQCDGPGPILGRWKLTPDDGCVWDADDSGPHQCAPAETATEIGPAADKPADVPPSRPSPTRVTPAGSPHQGPAT
jgi:hypothetical protein